MRGLRHGLHTAWRVLRAEGAGAAVDRARDRLAERAERRRALSVGAGGLGPAPVLTVLGMPFSPRLGGVPTQLRNRLAFESGERPCLTLSREGAAWVLERWHRGQVRLLDAGPVTFADAVARAVGESGARAVHCEGLAGLPLEDLLQWTRRGGRLLVSVHDYSVFCRRPHLIERPHDRFCHWCRDLQRCDACLGHEAGVEAGAQALYRERTAELLRSAEAVVFPSAFLRGIHAASVGGLDASRLLSIEPGTPPSGISVPRAAGVARHVAGVGVAQVHKGALVFEEVVRQLQAQGPRLRWTALGGGDPQILARFRRLPGLKVRGYWRAGALPAVLRRRAVDLALLLSVTPEAYSLILDECWRAGVPVVAFDHGAMADRIRRLGGGVLVPPEAGAEGIVRAVREAVAGPLPAVPVAEALPRPTQAAAAHLELYRRLGLLPAGSA